MKTFPFVDTLTGFFGQNKEDFPLFYRNYLECFEAKKIKNLPIDQMRLVVFDTETTGLDIKEDRILSIGAVAVQANSIHVKDAMEVYLEQSVFKPESVPIHGLLRASKYPLITEEQAIEEFLHFVGNSILVGHHVGFDLGMINQALKRLKVPKLKNQALDTGILYKRTLHQVNILNKDKQYSLDELCDTLNISKEDRHKASGDAFSTAIAFLKIRGRMETTDHMTYKKLTRG